MSGFLRGFAYAAKGIFLGSRGRNFRVMIVASLLVAAVAWWLDVRPLNAAVLALSIGLVLALELVNTAGEMLVDILSPEYDLRYGRVKDVLAGAVLVATLAAVIVGCLVLLGPLRRRLVG